MMLENINEIEMVVVNPLTKGYLNVRDYVESIGVTFKLSDNVKIGECYIIKKQELRPIYIDPGLSLLRNISPLYNLFNTGIAE